MIKKRLLSAPSVLIAAIVVLIEEWLWEDLQRIAAAGGRMPLFRQIESLIAGLPPYVVPANLRRCRAWDLAATKGGGALSCGTKIGVDLSGVYYVEDVKRVQWSADGVRSELRSSQQHTNAPSLPSRIRITSTSRPASNTIAYLLRNWASCSPICHS